jgi:hypothetical protein
MLHRFGKLFCILVVALIAAPSWAGDERRTMELGKLKMVAPKDWTPKEPTVRIIAYEFATPAAKEDKIDGRMTVMSAGGSIEDNIDRWYTQFSQEDGGDTKKRAKVEKIKVAGQPVHLVDIAGTYKDQRGPMAPAVSRKDYRMLGAIVETKEGNFFIKLYGPKRTIAQHERAFRDMIEGIKSE